MTVGDIVDCLSSLDRSLPVYLPDASGSPDDIAAIATVSVTTLSRSGALRVPGIAFLRAVDLSVLGGNMERPV